MAIGTSRIQVGVIGAGFIGPAHVESMRRLGFVDVVALAAGSQESAERKAAEMSIPKAYGSYLDLIRDPDVEVVDVASPNIHHYPAVKAALQAGKHVMCEKPLAMTSKESAELVALAGQTGLVSAVTFNMRFYPLLQQARAMIAHGDLGTIYSVHGGYWQDWLLFDTDYNWRVEAAQGGRLRVVGDLGSHWLDLAQFLTGATVTSVLAELFTFLPVRQKPEGSVEAFASVDLPRTPVAVDTEDAATVMLRLGDIRGTMQVSQMSAGRKNRPLIEVNGSSASLSWDGDRPNELWIGRRDRPNELLIKDPSLMYEEAAAIARYPPGHDEGFADTHTAIQRAFFEYIRARGSGSGAAPNFPTFVDGHRENVIADCILESAQGRRWIDVPPA
jgi:predicted dehydrogenase